MIMSHMVHLNCPMFLHYSILYEDFLPVISDEGL